MVRRIYSVEVLKIHLKDTINRVTSVGQYRAMQIMDAALGICGETSEFVHECIVRDIDDNEKKVEELGDLLWYIYSQAVAMDIFDKVGTTVGLSEIKELFKTDGFSEDELRLVIFSIVCQNADNVKKLVMKGHKIDDDTFISDLNFILVVLEALASRHNIDMGDAMSSAIDKFYTRYPDGVKNGEVR